MTAPNRDYIVAYNDSTTPGGVVEYGRYGSLEQAREAAASAWSIHRRLEWFVYELTPGWQNGKPVAEFAPIKGEARIAAGAY